MSRIVVLLLLIGFVGCEASKPAEPPKPAVKKDSGQMKGNSNTAMPAEPA